MSMIESVSAATLFADVALPLMKEYAEKITSSRDRLSELARKAASRRSSDSILLEDVKQLASLFKLLSPPVKDLADQVSQQIEHGNHDPVIKLALRIRLAELEHALLSGQEMLKQAQKKLGL